MDMTEKKIKLSRRPSEPQRKMLGIKKATEIQVLVDKPKIFLVEDILSNRNSEIIEYAADKILIE